MKKLLSSAVIVAAALVASPVFAGNYGTCVTDTNVSYIRGSEKNPTQTCKSLADCPTPSMFASLSGQVSNAANDLADTHYYEKTIWTKHGPKVVWTSPEKPGACNSY